MEEFNVRGYDKEKKADFNGWNTDVKVAVPLKLLDEYSQELFKSMLSYFLNRQSKLRRERMNWTLTYGECHKLAIGCPHYKDIIKKFSEQHPKIDFNYMESYQTSICVYDYVVYHFKLMAQVKERLTGQ